VNVSCFLVWNRKQETGGDTLLYLTKHKKEQAMYTAIRRLKVQPGAFNEAVRLVENEMVPILSSMPGFVEYVVVQIEEEVGLTISVFETQEQAEESNRRAAEWVKPHFSRIAAGPHEIVALGEVRFRKIQ
jgi:Antibiotic biosynthesis monooxygenase